jgi:hypothetical protein
MQSDRVENLLVEQSVEAQLILVILISAIAAVLGMLFVSQFRRYLRHRAARQRWIKRVKTERARRAQGHASRSR